MKNNANENRKLNIQTHARVKYYAGTPGDDLGDQRWDKELEPGKGMSHMTSLFCSVTQFFSPNA